MLFIYQQYFDISKWKCCKFGIIVKFWYPSALFSSTEHRATPTDYFMDKIKECSWISSYIPLIWLGVLCTCVSSNTKWASTTTTWTTWLQDLFHLSTEWHDKSRVRHVYYPHIGCFLPLWSVSCCDIAMHKATQCFKCNKNK